MLETLLMLLAAQAAAKPEIKITDFAITPHQVQVGQPFTIRVEAKGKGVKVGSYVIRSSHKIAPQDALPGFSVPRSGKAYLPGAAQGILHLDNGKTDVEPTLGVFAAKIETKGWRDGSYFVTVFAHNRPAAGPHVVDFRNLRIQVKNGKVTIYDLGGKDRAPASSIESVEAAPSVVSPGETFKIRIRVNTQLGQLEGCTLRNTYYIRESETLPGFRYDKAECTAYLVCDGDRLLRDNGPLDRDPAKDRIEFQFDTTQWPPGLYNFSLSAQVLGPYSAQQTRPRHLAVKVRSPQDHLIVKVEPSRRFMAGTHFGKLARLSNGTLIYGSRYSTDGGKTWKTYKTKPSWGMPTELRDGTVLGMAYRTFPRKVAGAAGHPGGKGEKGVFVGKLYESTDGGKTVTGPIESIVRVPQSKTKVMGHGWHYGPLFMRAIVECDDGSLVALMCGWFHGDDAPSPYGGGRAQSRSYACISKDRGRSWDFLANIAYDPNLGNEGYNEGCMKRLPNGEILCVLRTGTESKKGCLDNPLMQTVSRDNGRTWSEPQRMGVEGVYPDLLVMSDGTLAVSYGRPGAKIMFSTDAGRTWTDHTNIDATPYSGYTGMCEIAPGAILYGFGCQGYLDEATGKVSNCLRLTTIRVQRAP